MDEKVEDKGLTSTLDDTLDKNSTDMKLEIYLESSLAEAEKLQKEENPLMAIRQLDKATIICGAHPRITERTSQIERAYCTLIEEHNSSLDFELELDAIPQQDELTTTGSPVSSIQYLTIDGFYEIGTEPFQINKFASNWPAIKKWTRAKYFYHNYGHRLVPVEIGPSYLHQEWTQKYMLVREFMQFFRPKTDRNVSDPIVYMAQYDLLSQIPSLEDDIIMPKAIEVLGSISESIQRNLWIGVKGTRSPLHFDPYDNFFIQVVGWKKFFLVSPIYSEALQRTSMSNTSDLKVDSLVLDKSHVDICVHEVNLGPGDLLFIPRGWWHLVKGLTDTISVSFWI